MKVLDVGTTALAAARVHISPVNQLVTLTRLVASGRRHPTMAAHRDQVCRALAHPRVRILADLIPPQGRGVYPVASVRPGTSATTLEAELEQIRHQSQAELEESIALAGVSTTRVDAALAEGTLGHQVADALHLLWRATLAPDWSRLEALLREEVARRGQDVVTKGWGATIDALHPTVSWVTDGGSSSVVLNKRLTDHAAIEPEGSLVLIPCLFLWEEPLVTMTGIQHGVYYPLVVTDERRLTAGDPMARALGSTRAKVLAALDHPSTTSRLATSLDLPLSTVSTHLGVLREAGLVTRTRTGQSVTYARRPLSA